MTTPLPTDHDDDILALDDPVYTLTEAAQLLKVDPSFLGRLFREGRIGGFRMGKRVLIRKSDILAYIAREYARCPAAQKAGPEPTHIHVNRLTRVS